MNDQGVAVLNNLVQTLCTAHIGLYNLGIERVGHVGGKVYRRAAAAHDEEVGHVGIVLFAGQRADCVGKGRRGHEEHHVVGIELVVAVGNERIVAALYRHNMIRHVGTAKLLERNVEYFRAEAHLDAEQHERTALHLPPLAHPTAVEIVQNLLRCQHFGINNGVDAHRLEKLAMLRQGVFGIVHARHGLLRPQLAGKHTARHVVRLVGRNADKQVGLAHLCFAQGGNR